MMTTAMIRLPANKEVSMAAKPKTATDNGAAPRPLSLEETMAAILGLLVDEREERRGRGSDAPTELVLFEAGLDYGAISRVTGRPYPTVQTTIRRAVEARSKKAARS
jgi:hypothetical protein